MAKRNNDLDTSIYNYNHLPTPIIIDVAILLDINIMTLGLLIIENISLTQIAKESYHKLFSTFQH